MASLRSDAVSLTGFCQWKSSIVMENCGADGRASDGTPPRPSAVTVKPKDLAKVRLFIESLYRGFASKSESSLHSAKGRDMSTAPKARNMKARGKRETRRPWVKRRNDCEALKERNNRHHIPHFQCSPQLVPAHQGRRASRCSALAPGYQFRAFGAVRIRVFGAVNFLRLWRCED